MKSKPTSSFFRAGLAATLLLTVGSTSLFAAPLYWDTNGTTAGSGAATGNWGTSNFWTADATGSTATSAYVPNSDVVFSAGTNGTAGTVTVTGTQNVNSVTFNQPTSVTLSGGTLAFSGPAQISLGTAITAATNTISSQITGTSGMTVTAAVSAGFLDLRGTNTGLSGAVAIGTVGGAGTPTIEVGVNNANALGSGTVSVNNATLHVGNAVAVATLANPLQIAGTGVGGRGAVRISSAANLTGGITLTAAASIVGVNNASTISTADLALGTNRLDVAFVGNSTIAISSAITGTTGSLFVSGNANAINNVLTLSGNNTYAGGTEIRVGALAVGSNTALGTGTLTLSGGGGVNNVRIQSDSSTARTLSNAVVVAGANAGSVFSFGAHTGTTTPNPGAAGTGDLTFSNTTSTSLGGLVRNFQIDNAVTTFNGGFTSAGGFTKSGTGEMVLNGTNTYTGNTTVTSGIMTLGATSAMAFNIGASGVNNSISGTGALNLNGTFNFNLALAAASGTWTIVDVNNLTETYGAGFNVAGFTETTPDVWTRTVGAVTYTYTQATGVLMTIPEPSAVLLGGLSILGLAFRRNRRAVI